MKEFARRLAVKWLICSLGLWLAAALLSNHISVGNSLGVVVAAGLVLAVLNMLVRPLIIFFTLPAVIVTLGLFMIVINGLVVLLASRLYPPLHIAGFWSAVFAGLVIGLVNYLVTTIWEERHERA
jgi:putative membrane protein